MKKLALALVCLVSVAFFASCTPEGDPTIQVLNEEGYVQSGDVVDVNTDFNFGFVMASNAQTGKELTSLILKIDEETPDTLTLTGNEYTYKGTLHYEFTRDEFIRYSTITAIVTDAAGKTASTSITLSINNPAQELVVTPFEWRRDAGGDGTGLAEFGLQWTSNTSTNAIIKPLEGATLYRFENSDVWDNTKTDVDKEALFSELTLSVAQFSDVSVTAASQTYDIVLGTTYNGENHLIHVTGSTANQRSWHFSITGEAK